MLTILISWALLIALVVYFNAKFWGLFPDTQSDEGNAKERQIKPFIEPTPIPKSHYINYYIDWAIVIAVLVIMFS